MSMTLLQRVEVGAGGAASIDFTSIPQTYTDLQLVVSGRINDTVGGDTRAVYYVRFNSSTSSYSGKLLYGTGSGVGSQSNATNGIELRTSIANNTSNTFGSESIYIPNYAGSTYKSVSAEGVQENNATAGFQNVVAGLWSNTAAITSISLVPDLTFTWLQYSTASLYGIAPQTLRNKVKATGGTINYSNGYWYHTFTGSSSFSPISSPLQCEVLTVAGGAGGSGSAAAAGGAGGVLKHNLTINSQHAVLVGAGGPNTLSSYNTGGNSMLIGSDAATLTPAYGGGGGGYRTSGYLNGQSGGSGGGGSGNGGSGYGSGGSGTSGQGNSGGLGPSSYSYASGGGGGAGAAGGNSDGTNGGSGGVGTSAYSSWGLATSTGHNVSGTVYYAGGGGGGGTGYASSSPSGAGSGPGGYGGGGAGGNGTSYSNAGTVLDGVPGTANTGGGGGGGAQEQGAGRDGMGGAGGSGIVIIRYLAD
jgi:hypothetical protein